jgi:hypothetical protein
MMHPLCGRKQTREHIAKRIASYKSHPRRLRNLKIRILNKIKTNTDGCWVWIGARFKKTTGDYGQIRMGTRNNSKVMKAHRVSYECFNGEIPTGLELDHLCKNTLCVNPIHLEPTTHIENCRRRKDHGLPYCKHGHKYTKETTYINPRGVRECRVCKRNRGKP